MLSFEIDTYNVTSQLQRFPGETRPSRVLDMTGPILTHGIQNHALFGFDPFFDGVWATPVAGYISYPGGYNGLTLVGWFPLYEYEYYYEILREQTGLQVIYDYTPPQPANLTGYLSLVGLGDSSSQVGNAPSASMAEAMLQIARIVPMPTQKDLPERKR